MTTKDTEWDTEDIILDRSVVTNPPTTSATTERWWLVLPCLICIMLASSAIGLLKNDLLVYRYSIAYGIHIPNKHEQNVCRQKSTTYAPEYYLEVSSSTPKPKHTPDYNLVQSSVADFNIKNSLITFVPSLVSFVLLGANCDTIGRRPVLLLPFLGRIVENVILLFVVTQNLSDTWIFVAQALEAMLGTVGLLVLSALSYITDCTSEKIRTRAFLIAELIFVFGRVLPTIGLGLWLRSFEHSYVAPISVSLALSVLGALYVLLIQPESIESMKTFTILGQLCHVRLRPIVRAFTVFIVKRSSHKQRTLIIITIVKILLLLVHVGYISVQTLYLYGRPFCMNAFQVSLLLAVTSLAVFVFTLIATLTRMQLDGSYLLPMIGIMASIVHHVIFAVVDIVWLLYLAACIGGLTFIIFPVLRTRLTQAVQPNEYAIVFIVAGIIETIGRDAVIAIANAIYKASIEFFPGLVFVIFSGIALINIVLLGYLMCSTRKNTDSNTTADDVELCHYER